MLQAIAVKIIYALLPLFHAPWNWSTVLVYYFCHSAYIAFGPLLYFYLRSYLQRELKPFHLASALTPVIFPFVPFLEKVFTDLIFMQLYFLFFLILSFSLILNAHQRKKPALPFYQQWTFIIWFVYLIIWFSVNFLFIDYSYYIVELSVLFTSLFYVAVISGIRQFWFIEGDKNIPAPSPNLRLDINEEEKILTNIEQIIKIQRIYTDPEITLPKVAALVNTSPHKVSHVINNRLGMSFNEYINLNRVNGIKEAILKPEYQTTKLAGLAFDYGFNSISAFNTAFRKFTNTTPSQYRKINQSQVVDS